MEGTLCVLGRVYRGLTILRLYMEAFIHLECGGRLPAQLAVETI